MAFSVNTNIASLQAQNYLRTSSDFQSKTINRVTSGLRIVSSGDDAAGLAIANSFRSDQAVLTQGIRNANDGLSTLQTIDGGMSNISNLLDRARTLATQSASGTFTGDRAVLNAEFSSVITEIDRQAQAIGLDTGGQFAKSLSVFIGGGKLNNGTSAISNGSVGVDLTTSTVDARSLGLKGVSAVGATGTDIGTGSASTSVAKILANTSNTTSATGYTDFYVQGPGFAGNQKINLHVNLAGVTDASTLATAVNTAIQSAGNGTTQQATAFKNANVAASITTDSSGKQQLSFSSSSTALQVQAGDAMANALMGNFSTQAAVTGSITTATVDTNPSNTLTFTINKGTAFSVSVTSSDTAAMTTIANDLNNDSNFSAVATARVDSTGHMVVTAKSNLAGTSIDISGNAATAIFGSANPTAATTAGQGKNTTSSITGAATTASTQTGATIVRIQGGGLASPKDITLAAGTTAVQMASLYTQVAADADLQAAGITVNNTTPTNALVFTSAHGEAMNVSTLGDTTNALGLGSWNASSDTGMSGKFDYTSITGAAGTFGAVTGQTLDISISGGATVRLKTGTLSAATEAAAIVALNQAIANDTTLSAAGLKAKDNGAGQITIYSTNGTEFRLGAENSLGDGTAGAGANILGFGAAGPSAAATTAIYNSSPTDVTTNVHVDAGGSSATSVYQFAAVANAQDSQTITVAANDNSGTAHSLGIVLSNNSTARNARSLDEAVATINTQLQQSNDSTLKQVVAVKDAIVDNTGTVTEGIRFVSALGGFTVSFGKAGTTGTVGIGKSTEQGSTISSSQLAGGGTADISNQTTAQNAVTALADAVNTLGKAQAVVGKGQNNFNYASNLAQSQLTNLAAAESRIRDADLASEAANLSKAQILVQAGTAALAQANSAPQAILSLLRG